MKLSSYCDKIIEYAFYAIFLLVPLFFTNNTSELFELNKMWLTWGLTIVIAVAWITKMVIHRRFSVRRTPLDIPLLLFLASQVISTIISLDTHISLWGYYSRFNGGLYSLIAYVFLYFAFVSNLSVKHVLRVIYVSIASGVLVALWGIPSHFGHDPTCLLFRGTFDVSCWTSAFQPTIRIFSTLGQPAWLAAYIGLLIPLVFAVGLRKLNPAALLHTFFQHNQQKPQKQKQHQSFLGVFTLRYTLSLLIAAVFYLTLLFTNTRAGFLAFWISFILFWTLPGYAEISGVKKIIQAALFIFAALAITYFTTKDQYLLFWLIPVAGYFGIRIFFNKTYLKPLLITTCLFFLVTISSGTQTGSLGNLLAHTAAPANQAAATGQSSLDSGGTDSGKIRLFVWKGAFEAWKTSPIFGTGVETFAFAYYLHKPVGHNLTSEWDYLYNKAHNEYLNYLTTTGIVGLGTYSLIILVYLFLSAKYLLFFKANKDNSERESLTNFLIPLGLIAAYISILVSNFFGFSVVIINVYFFLIPGFAFLFMYRDNTQKLFAFPKQSSDHKHVNPYQWTTILIVACIGGYLLLTLSHYWSADTKYALGHNLDLAGQYQTAYPYLTQAVSMRQSEPIFKDELAVNEATLATALALQKDATNAAILAQEAINLDDEVVSQHPSDVVMWKDRLRIFYTLAEANPQYMQDALKAALQAFSLAPTDAKIAYNLGVIYEQTGSPDKAVEILRQVTTYIKPDYRDAYYALALAYHAQAVDKSENVIHPELQQKAVEQLHYLLGHINPDDKPSKELLKSWGAK